MSWQDLAPAASTKLKLRHAVTLLVSKAGRFTQHATLTVRQDLMPTGTLGWWRHYEMVRVQAGDGPDAGRVRIMSGGPHRLTGPSGKAGKNGKLNAPHLKLYGLPEMPPVLGRQPVSWETVGDTLVVTLPWSDAKGMAKLWTASVPAAAGTDAFGSLAGLTSQQFAVLDELHRAGGRLPKVCGVSQTHPKAFRECAGKGLVEVAGDFWQFTPAAQRRFADAQKQGAAKRPALPAVGRANAEVPA